MAESRPSSLCLWRVLSYTAFFFSILGLGLVFAALGLDRRAPLNRAVAVAGIVFAYWSFCSIFVYAAKDQSLALLFHRLSFLAPYFGSSTMIWIYLVLARKSFRHRVAAVAPLVLFALFVFLRTSTTGFRYGSFQPGPLGNVGVPTRQGTLILISACVFAGAQGFALVVLLRARSRETSRRLRRILSIVGVLQVVTVGLTTVSLWAEVRFSLPPLTVLACGPGTAANLVLIGSHRYLVRRDPAVESELGAMVQRPVVFLDEMRRIVSMNPSAQNLLGGGQSELAGRDLASFVKEPAALLRAWDTTVAGQVDRAGAPCRIGDQEVFVHLKPHYDRFRDLSGAVAVIESLAGLEGVSARFRISPREREIIAMLRQGYRNKEIADALFVTVGTVKNHVVHIFRKTGASNRVELSSLFAAPERD